MQIANLRKRIQIQQPQKSQEPTLGQVRTQPQTIATVWARIEPLSGRELYRAQQVVAEVTHRVTIRARTGINEGMQVIYGTRSLGIGAVLNIEERGREMDLLCVEG